MKTARTFPLITVFVAVGCNMVDPASQGEQLSLDKTQREIKFRTPEMCKGFLTNLLNPCF
jgi:hypothetical protein